MNSRRLGCAVAGLAISLASSSSASAQPGHTVPYRLEYKAPAVCPNEQDLRGDIAERIGVDPFVADDPKTIAVEITRNRGVGFRALITITDPETPTTTRELVSKDTGCEEIVADVSLVLRALAEPILIELPKKVQKPAPEATSPPAPPPPTPPPVPPPPVQQRSASKTPQAQTQAAPSRLELFAGLFGAFLATPGPLALGGTIGGMVRGESWRFGLDLRGAVDVRGSSPEVPVDMSLWTGSASACFHRTLSVCGMFAVGFRHTAPDQVLLPRRYLPFAAAGLRLFYDLPLGNHFAGRLQGEVLAPLGQSVVRYGDGVIWSSEPVLPSLTLALVRDF